MGVWQGPPAPHPALPLDRGARPDTSAPPPRFFTVVRTAATTFLLELQSEVPVDTVTANAATATLLPTVPLQQIAVVFECLFFLNFLSILYL